MSGENLWPEDIAKVTTRAPAAILREQAGKLSELTGGLIQGNVVTAGRQPFGELETELRLVVPALNDYEYSLLVVRHTRTIYPAKVYCHDAGMDGYHVNSENDFLSALKQALGSQQVKEIVQSLMSQCAA